MVLGFWGFGEGFKGLGGLGVYGFRAWCLGFRAFTGASLKKSSCNYLVAVVS